MAGKRKTSANTAGGKKSKQQTGTGIAQTIKAAWGIKSHDVINSKYENERVLLKAKECYDNGKVPPEEKEYLFEYYVSGVNKDDNNTATLNSIMVNLLRMVEIRCWNLERLIVAKLNQQPAPDDLTLDDLIKEREEKEKDVSLQSIRVESNAVSI